MPYCPTHGPKSGVYCDECSQRLLPDPAAGDSVKIRSGEAHVHNTLNPTFVMPGAQAHVAAPLVKCPRCGRRNVESDVFDCQGPCGRQNLCHRHFDEEYDLCKDCAALLRGEAERASAAQATLVASLAQQQGRADAAERELAALQETLRKVQQERDAALAVRQQSEAALQAAAKALAAAEAELRPYRQAAEEAARRAAEERRAQAARAAVLVWQTIGIEMVKIPAGDFLYGESKRKVRLPEFSIAKTTVTNGQYKAFVDATGYTAPSHWLNDRPQRGTEDLPVVIVSWEDAQEFCRWADVRLPEEREWEKAARGMDGREYPWGNQEPADGLCNFNKESKIENLAAVGSYPAGASPYGLLDMAGNVWEWCEDWYDGGKKHRVLRGGSFYYNEDDVRCAHRGWGNPSSRFNNVGFRVASPGA